MEQAAVRRRWSSIADVKCFILVVVLSLHQSCSFLFVAVWVFNVLYIVFVRHKIRLVGDPVDSSMAATMGHVPEHGLILGIFLYCTSENDGRWLSLLTKSI